MSFSVKLSSTVNPSPDDEVPQKNENVGQQ